MSQYARTAMNSKKFNALVKNVFLMINFNSRIISHYWALIMISFSPDLSLSNKFIKNTNEFFEIIYYAPTTIIDVSVKFL